MKKTELRPVTVRFCDLCGKEITDHSHTVITPHDGSPEIDLHHTWVSDKVLTCYQAWLKQESERIAAERAKSRLTASTS